MSDQFPTEGEPLPPVGDATPPPPPPPPAAATPPPPMAAPGAMVGEQPLSPSDERMWAMLAHLGGIVFGFIPSLVIMLVFGKRSAFTNDQAKEALNFQITVAIAWFVALILTAVVIGALLLPIIGIVNLVFCIIAGLAANKGELYRYPFALRLVK